ncbi:DMT family transporter [Thaumasiovibrio subtropicus]|uniref:DMT family transporter n=1 Tax=Thaumasiovibrio subtropicus TaxID=1891207 RepID=UPI000B353334|nr:DMT family transporter [Thaumasiovibrio subtropicus]
MQSVSTKLTPQSNRHRQLGFILALTGCVLFSVKPVFVKLLFLHDATVMEVMFLRALFSVPIYVVTFLLLLRSQKNRALLKTQLLPTLGIGFLGYVMASYLDLEGLTYVTAQLERLIIFLFPSLVVFINWGFMGIKPSKLMLFTLVIGYVGIGLIVAHDMSSMGNDVLIGSAILALSALCFAIYLILSKKQIQKVGSTWFTCVAMGGATATLLLLTTPATRPLSEFSMETLQLGFLIGIVCTVLPSYLIAAAMARLSPAVLSLTSNAGPAITAALAVTVLGEVFTLWHAIGMILVIYSVYLSNKLSSQ